MIQLNGTWDSGYAYDYHTVRSLYAGVDDYGHDLYTTERTPMGELLYLLKYKSTWSQTRELVSQIVDMLCSNPQFVQMLSQVDIILTVPPSNKYRKLQPVHAIAEELAIRFRKGLQIELLQNTNTEQVKNLDTPDKYDLVSATASIQTYLLQPMCHYLIFDDIFDSGSTLRVYADKLKKFGCQRVSIFTLTKTKSNR